MKKLMSVMLGLSLIVGSASLAFGQAKDEPKKEGKKGKGGKKGGGKKDKDKDKAPATK